MLLTRRFWGTSKNKFGFRCQENFHLMQNYMPKHRRSWMSGCVRRAEVLASLSPTQNLHRGFNSTKGMACWWRGRVRRTLWWGSGINPSVLGKCRVWHGVAGNASCSLQYTLVGSQHCPLLLVPSAASGRRPHGRWRRLSGKGLWHATIRVVTPVFPTATLCMTVQLYARLLAVRRLAFLFQMQMPHAEQPLNVLCLFFWQSRLWEVWKDWVFFWLQALIEKNWMAPTGHRFSSKVNGVKPFCLLLW